MVQERWCASLALACGAATAMGQCEPPQRVFPPVLDAATLDGVSGFQIRYAADLQFYANPVAGVGDINGDGMADFALGWPRGQRDGRLGVGVTHVVFGRSDGGFGSMLELDRLEAGEGVRFIGVDAGEGSGSAIALGGDMNSDGLGDLLIGADNARPGGVVGAGRSYVVFGRAPEPWPLQFELSELVPDTGFSVVGGFLDGSGAAIASAGDIDGDGFDDLAVGAPLGSLATGSAYIVFGREDPWPAASVDLAELPTDVAMRFYGFGQSEHAGRALALLGDTNGDGLQDLAIGASPTTGGSASSITKVHVVFGQRQRSVFQRVQPLADLDVGEIVTLTSPETRSLHGVAVGSAGDVNADGAPDVVVGAPLFGRGGRASVLYGRPPGSPRFPKQRSAFPDGNEVVAFDGPFQSRAGQAVTGVGDFNGDGIDDFAIGARAAAPLGRRFAGAVYVVFGRDPSEGLAFPPVTNLADLNGRDGFVIAGDPEGWYAGASVAGIGDVNGDGVDDLLIGSDRLSSTDPRTGISYVVFGRRFCQADFDLDGQWTIADFLAFQSAFDAGDPAVDLDCDGSLSLFDFLAYVNAFLAGCP